MNNDKITFGEYLRAKRKDKNMSLRKLEEVSGISFSYLGKLERGENTPTKEMIEVLAKILELEEYDMLVLAGYLEEADLKFWAEVLDSIPAYGFKEKYCVNGVPDIMRFRSEFVHGNLDDDIREAINELVMERHARYQHNLNNSKSGRKIVDEIKEEVEFEYGEWLSFIDEMKELKLRPKDVKSIIDFYRTVKKELEWTERFISAFKEGRL